MNKLGETRLKNNVTYRCHYHVVWCSKYRRPVLTSENPSLNNPAIDGDPGPVDVRLLEIIHQVADEAEATILEAEVMPDHVRVLVSVDPTYGIGKLARMFKGRSSRLLRSEFPSLKRRLPTLWTNSYFVATVGRMPLEVVDQYLAAQRGH